MSTLSEQTLSTLNHHLQSIGQSNVAAIMEDYTEESALYTPNGPVRGLQALNDFFVAFLSNMPGFADTFEMLRQDVDGEVAYIYWKAPQYTPMGTDTFLVRDGKILVQTFAAYM